MRCAGCGAEVSANATFCGKCGARLAQAKKSEPSTRLCPTCQEILPASASSCPNCGERLEPIVTSSPIERGGHQGSSREGTIQGYPREQPLGGRGWTKTRVSLRGTYRVNSGSDDEFVVVTNEVGRGATQRTTYTRSGWISTNITLLALFYSLGLLIVFVSLISTEVCPIFLGIVFLGGALIGTWWFYSLTYRPPREFERAR